MIRHAECGDRRPHDRHVYREGYDPNTNQRWPVTCGGWTSVQAAAVDLLDRAEKAAAAYADRFPAGQPIPRLRLELHPAAYRPLLNVIGPGGEIGPDGVYTAWRPEALVKMDLVLADWLPRGRWQVVETPVPLDEGTVG